MDPYKMYINDPSYESVRKCNHRGSRLSRGHGTEQKLDTRGSVAEVENVVCGTIYCSGHERNKFSNSAKAWRKRGETTPLGVAVVSFRSVSTLGDKRVCNGSEVLCPAGNVFEVDYDYKRRVLSGLS